MIHKGKLTEAFGVTSGVRQGCILSPILFLVVLDKVMRRTIDNRRRGIRWGLYGRLEDLYYADDICLLSQRLKDMTEKVSCLEKEAAKVGLKINSKKTKDMRINSKLNQKIQMQKYKEEIETVSEFTYLGSIVTTSGGAPEDAKTQIKKANGRTKIFPRKPRFAYLIAMSNQ